MTKCERYFHFNKELIVIVRINQMAKRKGYKDIKKWEDVKTMQDREKWLQTCNEFDFINQQLLELYDLLESHDLVHRNLKNNGQLVKHQKHRKMTEKQELNFLKKTQFDEPNPNITDTGIHRKINERIYE